MPRKNVSSVWASFDKISNCKVRCKLCEATLTYSGGSTGSMHNHVNMKHGPGRAYRDWSRPSMIMASSSPAFKAKSPSRDPPLPSLDIPITSIGQKSCRASKADKISKLIAGLLAEASLPISLVDQHAFRDLMAFFEPGYEVPSQTSMTTQLQGMFEGEKQALAQQLRDAKSMALSTDCWKASNQEGYHGYMTVAVHFIDGEWHHQSKVLDTSPVNQIEDEGDTASSSGQVQRHTADAHRHQLKGVIEQWNLEGVVSAVVHDNTSNINIKTGSVGLGESIGVDDVACAAHSLQLSVGEGIDSNRYITKLVDAASRLVARFRQSTVQTKALESKQKQHRTPQHHLVQYCKTRWISIFMMLERLLESRMAICSVLKDRNFTSLAESNTLELTESQWILIEELIRCLRPLQLATTALSAKYNTSLSTVQPIVRSLIANHLKVTDNDSPPVADFKHPTSLDLKKRFCTEGDLTGPAMMATVIDVRFKGLTFLEAASRERAYDAVREALSPPEVDPSEVGDEDQAKRSRRDWSALDFLLGMSGIDDDTSTGTVDDMAICRQEFEDYIHHNYTVSNDSDPCLFWGTNADRFPSVAKLAKKYLAIPATSVPSGRAFSLEGDLITARRSCLKPENINMIVFLNNNK